MSSSPLSTGTRGVSAGKFGLVLFVVLWVASGIGAFAAPSPGAPVERTPATLGFSPSGTVLLNRDEALALAFPKCKIERSTAYLTEEQTKRIGKLAKHKFAKSVVYPYRATKNGKWVGTAYFDTHRVRSLRETLMVVVQPDGTIGRVEVLSFAEPRDYLPRAKWYAQFPGRALDDDLNINRKIRGVTGATLTSHATTDCCRRILALHQVLGEVEAKRKRDEEAKKRRTGATPASDS